MKHSLLPNLGGEKYEIMVNLTNHPSKSWGEKQMSAALEIADTIVDLAFPHIDPSATPEQIIAIVGDFNARIDNIRKYHSPERYMTANPPMMVIHVMGEMGFLHRFIKECKHNCIHSTSARIVKELGGGKKEVLFDFVQFRSYF